MHVINPIVFLICYMLFVNEQSRKIRFVLTAPIMVMLYFLFDYIRSRLVGEFVYGFAEPGELSFFYVIITGLVMYIFMYLLGLSLFALNRIVHKKAMDNV